MGALLYADDIAVSRHLQRALDNLAEHSLLMGFKFNTAKCEVVAAVQTNVQLYGNPLAQSAAFRYFGVMINHLAEYRQGANNDWGIRAHGIPRRRAAGTEQGAPI